MSNLSNILKDIEEDRPITASKKDYYTRAYRHQFHDFDKKDPHLKITVFQTTSQSRGTSVYLVSPQGLWKSPKNTT
jgi:hypothetical protein